MYIDMIYKSAPCKCIYFMFVIVSKCENHVKFIPPLFVTGMMSDSRRSCCKYTFFSLHNNIKASLRRRRLCTPSVRGFRPVLEQEAWHVTSDDDALITLLIRFIRSTNQNTAVANQGCVAAPCQFGISGLMYLVTSNQKNIGQTFFSK